MKKTSLLLAGVSAAILACLPAGAQVQPNAPAFAPGTFPAMPAKTTRTGKHINRIIDMWLKNQPVYYAQIEAAGYEKGKEMAATKADYITYEMEHGALDFHELREFMRGLVDGGPTRTGHRTPAVIVTLPIQTHAVKVDMPSTAPAPIKPEVVELGVDFDGTVTWNGAIPAGGTVTISYSTLDQLDMVCQRLSGEPI